MHYVLSASNSYRSHCSDSSYHGKSASKSLDSQSPWSKTTVHTVRVFLLGLREFSKCQLHSSSMNNAEEIKGFFLHGNCLSRDTSDVSCKVMLTSNHAFEWLLKTILILLDWWLWVVIVIKLLKWGRLKPIHRAMWQIHSWLWEINVFYIRDINRYQQIRVFPFYQSSIFYFWLFIPLHHALFIHSSCIYPQSHFFRPSPSPRFCSRHPPHAVSFLMYELSPCVIISVHVLPYPLLLSVFVSRILSWARAASAIGAAQINARVWINTCQKKKKKREPKRKGEMGDAKWFRDQAANHE